MCKDSKSGFIFLELQKMAARKMKEYVSSFYYGLHAMIIFDFIWKVNSNTDWKKKMFVSLRNSAS